MMEMIAKEDIDKAIQKGLETFRIEKLRLNQRKVIESYLNGRDFLFCSPTGSGKSLTFEMSPIIFRECMNTEKATLVTVVSPLIALMKNQNEKCFL